MSKVYKYYADNGNRIRVVEPDSILGYITIRKTEPMFGGPAKVNMVGVSKAHMSTNHFKGQACFEVDEKTHRNLIKMLNSPDKDSFKLAYNLVNTNLK